MKRFVIATVFLSVVLAFSTGAIADEQSITMVADPWAPYYSEELPGYGFAADIIKEALARKSYSVKFSTLPWKRALKMVEAGNYDAIPTAWFNEERNVTYIYSKPYTECRILFFTKKEKPIKWQKLTDLMPYKIGVVRGYSYSPEFTQASFLKKDEANDIQQNISKLLKDRTDLIIMDQYVGLYTINQSFADAVDKIIFHEKPVSMNKLHCMFSRKVPGIEKKIEAFNSGLEEIMNDGTYDKILVRHHLK